MLFIKFHKIFNFYCVHCWSLLRDERSENRLRNVKYSGCCILLLCRYAEDLVVFFTIPWESVANCWITWSDFQRIWGFYQQFKNRNTNERRYWINYLSPWQKPKQQSQRLQIPQSIYQLKPTEHRWSEINYRIQLAQVKFAEMSNLLQNLRIQLRTHITFLNCYVRSRLTYASQNWNLTGKQLDRLDTTYRYFVRRIIRNGFQNYDRDSNLCLVISNAELHRICGTEDVSSFIRTQQKKNIHHMLYVCLMREQ